MVLIVFIIVIIRATTMLQQKKLETIIAYSEAANLPLLIHYMILV